MTKGKYIFYATRKDGKRYKVKFRKKKWVRIVRGYKDKRLNDYWNI